MKIRQTNMHVRGVRCTLTVKSVKCKVGDNIVTRTGIVFRKNMTYFVLDTTCRYHILQYEMSSVLYLHACCLRLQAPYYIPV